MEHVGRCQLDHGLGRQQHGGIFLAPCFLRARDPVADGLVLEEDPRLVDDEHLESRGIRGFFDLRRCPLQDVKQKWLQYIGVVRPPVEVEGLEARERERVLGIVEEMAELPRLRPAIEALPERSEDGGEVGERAYLCGQLVNALDCGKQCLLVFGR